MRRSRGAGPRLPSRPRSARHPLGARSLRRLLDAGRSSIMPYEKPVLGLEEARKAMAAMLEEALKTPDRPIAIAICDDQGELVAFARMDRCAPLPLTIARK